MKSYRIPAVTTTVLLLLVHLIDDAAAERDDRSISSTEKRPRKAVLKEVIITGGDNDTQVIMDLVTKNSTRIGDEIFSRLSKRGTQSQRNARKPSSKSDQDANQSRIVLVDARNDEINLERLNHAIAGYEPRRITSRKTKRKTVGGQNTTHDARGTSGVESAESTIADVQRIYHEMLRNISRTMPELIASNVNATTFNPYLSQATKSSKHIRVPDVIATTDNAEISSSSVDSSHTSPVTVRNKKTKKLLKKYLQANRTTTASRDPSVGESKLKEANTSNSGSTKKYLSVPNGKSKNASLSLQSPVNAHSNSTKKPGSRETWNLQESSTPIPLFISRPNVSNAYDILNDLNNLNVQSGANILYLPSKYTAVPRPFSISHLPNSPVTNNLEVLHRKPSSSSVNPQQIARSSGNVLPLVLPTDLFNPAAARRYAPIKRTSRLNSNGNSVVKTETSPPTKSPLGEGITFESTSADYDAPYTDVIGTVRSPPVAVNGHQSSGRSDYYPITGNPAERTAAETAKTTTAYVPRQTSVIQNLQRPKEPQIIRKNDHLPRIDVQGSSNDGKLDPNFNIGLALYNKFASMYSANAPKAVAQDYQNFQQPASPSHTPPTSQQVPAFSYYVTLKPNSPPSSKIRPTVSAKPALAPYYDSSLLVSQNENRKEPDDENDKESVETNEQSRLKDESEEKADDDKKNLGNYQINREAYKIRKSPKRIDSEEDRYQQQTTRDYHGHQARQHRHRDENDEREKYESDRPENDEDEEESDETPKDKHVSTEDENEQNRNYYHRYGNYRYDREDPEEEQQRNDKEYENRKDRQKTDRRTDIKQKTVSKEKYPNDETYSDEIYKQNKERNNYYDRKKSVKNNRRKKTHRQDHRRQDLEDESADEDKVAIAQRSEDQDEPRKEYEKKRIDRREEYSESNPKHIRKEYHQHSNDDGDHRHHGDQEVQDHVHDETQEHEHKHKEHHEKKKHGGNHNFEEGEGAELDEEHHGHEGEKGDKGYKVWHEHEKAEKGHHDKEHASKKYDEKDGEEKKHEEEGGYHEERHHGEKGDKTAEFGEKGEHKKGHSTHGEHSVHKKDEYEKKTEFFDEFHENGDTEKHGEHHHEHESKKGGHEKKGHHDAADHEEKYGKEEKHEKGGHHHEHKGHKVDEGHDHHYDHDEKYGKKKGHEHGKEWSFKKGDDGGHKR